MSYHPTVLVFAFKNSKSLWKIFEKNTLFHKNLKHNLSKQSPGGVLWRKVFLKIPQNSLENICARVSF